MEAMILDQNFMNILTADYFQSFIWTDKYYGYGDFEIYAPPIDEILKVAQKNNYVWFRLSNRMMRIRSIELNTDLDTGNMLTISGKSLEQILEQRTIYGKTTLRGNLQNAIEQLLNACIISPKRSTRKIDHFVFDRSTDPSIKELTVEREIEDGENLYDVVYEICLTNELGFKIEVEEREDENHYKHWYFVFSLYRGLDRSYDQELRPPVAFSPNFENLLTSRYFTSYDNYQNVVRTVVSPDSDGNGGLEFETYLSETEPRGLDRIETYISGMSKSDDMTDGEYRKQLNEEAKNALLEVSTTEVFDGEMDAQGQCQYGRDFSIGDVVQVVNEYGMQAKSRVTAITFSSDNSGESIYPTFENIDSDRAI